jgi:hypothetical protein
MRNFVGGEASNIRHPASLRRRDINLLFTTLRKHGAHWSRRVMDRYWSRAMLRWTLPVLLSVAVTGVAFGADLPAYKARRRKPPPPEI